jgi:type I restriction enzyme S subunit
MVGSLSNLPPAWFMATVGEVFDVVGGGTPSTDTQEYWGGTTPWITSADIEGVRQINVRKYVSDKGIAESTTNKVPAKTLLVVTRVGLGKVAISDTPLCFSQDLQGLIQNPELIVPEYALHLLSYQLQFLKFAGQGTTISGVTKKQLKDLAFPLPPTAEQHRIVAKIEELFSELDQGVASLKTAREQLKVYRQSLLKNAFEGKLTADWRAAHRDQLETAATLQQRIARERQARYQQQLADWQTAGQPGPKPKLPKPQPPLTAEELAELPELPAGWGWVSVSQLLAEELCNGKSVKDLKGGFPVLRLNALGDGKIDLSIQKEGAWTAAEAKAYLVEVGDFLVSRGNGSKHLVGRGGFVSSLKGMLVAFPDTMIRIRLMSQLVDFRYFGLCWDSMLVRSQIENTARTTAGIYKINQELIEAYKIPLPTGIEEQQLIVQELEAKLSEADQLDQTLATALQQADALRQSILKKAFSGQLVAQDENDEPATALLERIRAARANSPAKGRQVKMVSKPLPNC